MTRTWRAFSDFASGSVVDAFKIVSPIIETQLRCDILAQINQDRNGSWCTKNELFAFKLLTNHRFANVDCHFKVGNAIRNNRLPRATPSASFFQLETCSVLYYTHSLYGDVKTRICNYGGHSVSKPRDGLPKFGIVSSTHPPEWHKDPYGQDHVKIHAANAKRIMLFTRLINFAYDINFKGV